MTPEERLAKDVYKCLAREAEDRRHPGPVDLLEESCDPYIDIEWHDGDTVRFARLNIEIMPE